MQIVNEILDPRVPFFSWGFAFSIGRLRQKMESELESEKKRDVVKERYKESRENETTRN